jgi:malate synthase
MAQATTDRVTVLASDHPEADRVLTPAALGSSASLHDEFDERRRMLLRERDERQARIRAGEMPDFLESTRGGAGR